MNKFVESTQLYVLSRGIGIVKIGVSKVDSIGYLYLGPLSAMPTVFDCDHTLIQGYILFENGTYASSIYDNVSCAHVWKTYSWEAGAA